MEMAGLGLGISPAGEVSTAGRRILSEAHNVRDQAVPSGRNDQKSLGRHASRGAGRWSSIAEPE